MSGGTMRWHLEDFEHSDELRHMGGYRRGCSSHRLPRKRLGIRCRSIVDANERVWDQMAPCHRRLYMKKFEMIFLLLET